MEEGDFVYNRLFAWKGSFAEATAEQNGCYVSNEFPTFRIINYQLRPGYLWAYFAQPTVWDYIESLSTGTTSTSRLRLKEPKFMAFTVPLPSCEIQDQIAALWRQSLSCESKISESVQIYQEGLPAILERLIPLREQE